MVFQVGSLKVRHANCMSILSFLVKYVVQSQRDIIFKPYLSGFDGRYILKGQHPRNPSIVSSIVTKCVGVKYREQLSANLVQIRLKAANLSLFLRSPLVVLSSNLHFKKKLKPCKRHGASKDCRTVHF